MEMICAIVHQLTRDLSPEEIKKQGFADYYVDHTLALWPQAAGGTPFSATFFQSKGDPITDLHENMAAEQKARTTYDNIIRLTDDPDVLDPIRFLREREIVHFQRFGEALRIVQDHLDDRNFYAFNPAFDKMSAHKQEVRSGCMGEAEENCPKINPASAFSSANMDSKQYCPANAGRSSQNFYSGNTSRMSRNRK